MSNTLKHVEPIYIYNEYIYIYVLYCTYIYIYTYSIYLIPFKPWFSQNFPADQRWRSPTPAKESVFEDGAFHFDVISLEAATRKAGTPDSLGASSFLKGNKR